MAVGDKRFQEKCYNELFVKRKDRAMIIVSHNDNFVRDRCDRAAVLARSTLTEFDDMDEAFAFYQANATG